ncbi:MAG: hypothetical protein PVG24_02655 [Gammaproteobacteria bacterium]|jgi:hypothetical protein
MLAPLLLIAAIEPGIAQEPETGEDVAAAVAEIEPAVDVSEIRSAASDEESAGAGSSGVMDRLDLGTTSITGNQELPKVLYIVPWKRSDLGNLVGRPVNTLLDEVLAPVDPEVFERHLDYYDTLYGESEQE